MPYLLDSDIVIDHLENVPDAVQLVSRLAPSGITMSIITYMEAYQGILRSPDRVVAEQRFSSFVHAVPVLPISEDVARRCAGMREDLRKRGKRVRPRALDLLIAATSLELQLTLVTRNTVDYEDVPDLSIMPLIGPGT